ncbi:hypothetical protein ACSBR2_032046 [Camellia fascicularis]
MESRYRLEQLFESCVIEILGPRVKWTSVLEICISQCSGLLSSDVNVSKLRGGRGIGNFPPMKTLSLIDVSAIDDGFWLLQETSQEISSSAALVILSNKQTSRGDLFDEFYNMNGLNYRKRLETTLHKEG